MAFKVEEKGNLTTLFSDKVEEVELATKAIAMELFKNVILKTPVETGRARGNWNCSIDAPDESISESVDKNGSKAINKVVSVVSESKLGDKIYLSNNLPYIAKLEYGGYSKKSTSGKTVDGYSKQAPQGMVRISLQEVKNDLKG